MNNSITEAQVFALCGSESQFPIDFDSAWKWIGYSRKDNAKAALLGAGFTEGLDLLINQELGTLAVPVPEEQIFLTTDCFKMWAMMAGTEKGRETRKYFLECERRLKAIVSQPAAPSLMDLTHGQLYRLAAYFGAKKAGLSPSDELVEGISPIFLTASANAVWLAEKKKFLESNLDVRLAEATILETYGTDDEEESLVDLFDELARDTAVLEADPAFRVPFDEFESRLKAISASGANINILPPMHRVKVRKGGISHGGQRYISPDLPVGQWVWLASTEQGEGAVEWRKDSGEYGGKALPFDPII